MRVPSVRCLLTSAAIAIFFCLEILLIFKWQQHADVHVVNFALALGALLAPSLYLVAIISYTCTHPRKSPSEWSKPSADIPGWRLPRRIPIIFHIFVGVSISFIGFLAVAIFMSSTSAWCCVRESRQLELCDLAAAVAKVFNQNGLDYHVTFGTLLGIMRSRESGDSKELPLTDNSGDSASKTKAMIPWEHDLDIAIAEKQVGIAYKLLKERGFNLERRSPTGVVAFRIHLPGASIWAAAWAMSWIDVYPFVVEKHTGEIISKNLKNYMKRPLISDVKPYRNISFCGFDSFSSPRLPLRFVRKQFGPHWRKPEFPDNYRNNTCRLFKDC